MRSHRVAPLIALAIIGALAACSSETGPGTTSTTAGSTGAGGAGGAAGVGGAGGAGGGAAACVGLVADQACASCAETTCCDALAACGSDETCKACLAGDNEKCFAAPKALYDAVYKCELSNCNDVCPRAGPLCDGTVVLDDTPSGGSCVTIGGTVSCNPLTGEGCDIANGEVCATGDGTHFSCAPGMGAPLCGDCFMVADCESGAFCTGSIYKCTKWCCSDADCGAGNHCVTPETIHIPGLGFCLDRPRP